MKLYSLIKKNYPYLVLTVFIVLFFGVNVRMNIFSYENFDFGKFDLGNMVQMIWNTMHGRFMYLTDYFGTNLPRWGMSHVDPIILLFLPIFALFPHPLTLVFAQVLLVLCASILVYLISMQQLQNKVASLFIALAYLSYPALGYLTAKTTFHGVTAALPFFFLTFYLYSKMYLAKKMPKGMLTAFWISLIILLAGKEQISLYVFLFGIYAYFFGTPPESASPFKKNALVMIFVGLTWFIMTFFVIIPRYAHYRVDGYAKFAQLVGISDKEVRNVALENYFLSRYAVFGDSYIGIIKGVLANPNLAIKIVFGGDKLENFYMTFNPVLFLSFGAPQILTMAVPDLLMNYLTSESGIGTSEIQNHRISMIIPVLFVSAIFAIAWISTKIKRKNVASVVALLLLISNIYFSFQYNNPVFMWLRDGVKRRLPTFIAQAKTNTEIPSKQLKLGEVVKLAPIESKDRECAQKIVNIIPDGVSVTGPDYLGAHLSQRETYAIFPALYNSADYVIIDVFSKKILNLLDLDASLTTEIANRVVKDPNYKLETSCGNIFVYKKVGAHQKSQLLPIQEIYKYQNPKYDFEIYSGLTLVDYNIPQELKRGEDHNAKFVYLKKDQLSSFILYLTFVNTKTGDVYESVNLPSFAQMPTETWTEDYYYSEDIDVILPSYLDPGDYDVFIGMTNFVKTRNIYLGEVNVL